jgi:hypothetical protein
VSAPTHPIQSLPTQPPPAWQPPRRRGGRKVVLTIAAGIAGLFLIGAILGNSDQPNTTAAQHSGISKGLGSADASADIDKIRLSTTADAIGIKQGFVQITNHSKGISDYYIEMRIMGATGVNLGMTNATADNVEPGQTARADFMVTDDSADHVEIVQVQRTASS